MSRAKIQFLIPNHFIEEHNLIKLFRGTDVHLLQQIITGDETFVHYVTPREKLNSMTCKLSVVTDLEPRDKLLQLAKNFMAIVFLGCNMSAARGFQI